MLERFVGQTVIANTYGHRKYLGQVSRTTFEYIVLNNALCLDHLESSKFDEQLQISQIEDGVEIGYPEILIWLNHLESITSVNEITETSIINGVSEQTSGKEDNVVPSPSENSVQERSTEESSPGADPSLGNNSNFADRIQIRLGVDFVKMFSDGEKEVEVTPSTDDKQDGTSRRSIVYRISQLRSELAERLGFQVPDIRVKTDVALDSGAYQIRINDLPMAIGEVHTDLKLAIETAPSSLEGLEGIEVEEPVFGISAVWLKETEQIKMAELKGNTVVDPGTILVTHLREILLRQAAEFYSIVELEQTVSHSNSIVKSLYENTLTNPTERHSFCLILADYLREGFCIAGIGSLLESFYQARNEHISWTNLIHRVRTLAIRQLLKGHHTPAGEINLVRIEAAGAGDLGQLLVQPTNSLMPEIAQSLFEAIEARASDGLSPVLVVPDSRKQIVQLFSTLRRPPCVITEEDAGNLQRRIFVNEIECKELGSSFEEFVRVLRESEKTEPEAGNSMPTARTALLTSKPIGSSKSERKTRRALQLNSNVSTLVQQLRQASHANSKLSLSQSLNKLANGLQVKRQADSNDEDES